MYIQLSNRPSDDIVLASSSLREALYFNRIINGDKGWNNDRHKDNARVHILDDEAEGKTTIHCFALRFVGDASDMKSSAVVADPWGRSAELSLI